MSGLELVRFFYLVIAGTAWIGASSIKTRCGDVHSPIGSSCVVVGDARAVHGPTELAAKMPSPLQVACLRRQRLQGKP